MNSHVPMRSDRDAGARFCDAPGRWGLVGWRTFAPALLILLGSAAVVPAAAAPRSVVFILIDDLRYDAMSFMGHPHVKTPALDSLAATGVHFKNAFVTTSLCSPSRASYLTGLYAHKHNVLDNVTLLDPSLPTFPRLLQQAGYKTAFIGKWHMGGASDDPQPGFDYWASFRGQGDYRSNRFNINGQPQKIDEYVTDAITRLSVDWLKAHHDKPFLLYVSHKAVHGAFIPAARHATAMANAKIEWPASMDNTPENYFRRPRWVLEQRQSFHGVDDPYHQIYPDRTLTQIVRDYYACVLAVDDSVATLVQTLKELGRLDSTLIIFTSDNGFLWGEHGLIDKRCMYEESIRVPMIASCPALYGPSGKTAEPMVLSIDVAPTILEAAGVPVPAGMQGRSFLNLPNQPAAPWRKAYLYEYFWERSFPQSPTCIGVRTDRHKYIRYHGIWDTEELYDLQDDPRELHNRLSTGRRGKVVPDPDYLGVYQDLRQQLDKLLEESGAAPLLVWTR